MCDLAGPLIALAFVVAVSVIWVAVPWRRADEFAQVRRMHLETVKAIRAVLKRHDDSLAKLETQINGLRQEMEEKDGGKTNS